MTNTYMFDKWNKRSIMSIQRQAVSIIESFFYGGGTEQNDSFRSKNNFVSPLSPSLASFLSFEKSQKQDQEKPVLLNKEKSILLGTKGVLLGKPLFTITPNKVTVQLFYYSNSPISNDKLSLLGNALTRCWQILCDPYLSSLNIQESKNAQRQGKMGLASWNLVNNSQLVFSDFLAREKKQEEITERKKLNVELQVIRLNYPILDSSIFAQYLTHNAGKYSFNRIMDMLKNSLPTVSSEGSLDSALYSRSHITGVKVRLSGRLTTQTSGPRQTMQAGRIGSSSRGPYSLTDYNQKSSKNKLGAFTIKVWISQQSR